MASRRRNNWSVPRNVPGPNQCSCGHKEAQHFINWNGRVRCARYEAYKTSLREHVDSASRFWVRGGINQFNWCQCRVVPREWVLPTVPKNKLDAVCDNATLVSPKSIREILKN